jgi:hypothetical protein
MKACEGEEARSKRKAVAIVRQMRKFIMTPEYFLFGDPVNDDIISPPHSFLGVNIGRPSLFRAV